MSSEAERKRVVKLLSSMNEYKAARSGTGNTLKLGEGVGVRGGGGMGRGGGTGRRTQQQNM